MRDRQSAKKKNRNNEACFICANTGAFRGGYGGYRIGGRSYEIKFCERCGLGRTEPFLDDKALREIYSTVYREDDSKRFFGPIEKFIRVFRLGRAKRVERLCGVKKGRILDIGCGRGDFLALMAERGWEAVGLELDKRVAAHGRKTGLDLRAGSLEETRFPDGHFDVVMIWHVFEHLRQPEWVMKECARILKPGGLFVVAVPNAASLQGRLTGRHWFHLDPPYHLYHYTLENIKKLMKGAGFEVKKAKHLSLEFNPFGYLQSFFNAFGFKPNMFYDFLRSNRGKGAKTGFGDYFSLAVMAASMPITLPLSFTLSFAEAALGRGGTVEVYARKKGGS